MKKLFFITIGFLFIGFTLSAQDKDNQAKDPFAHIPNQARYEGGIEKLAKQFGEKYNSKKHRPKGDSIVVFNAFVDQKDLNELEKIELIKGEKSNFSDFILEGLKGSGKKWHPEIQSGREVKSVVKIYARLNKDGSITMATSRWDGMVNGF